MRETIFGLVVLCFTSVYGQLREAITVNDAFVTIATDAIAAGQGDIGVATAPDAFSQIWNPSKYVFSNKKSEVGLVQIAGANRQFADVSQLNLNFYNKLNDRKAYAVSFKGYSILSNLELSIDASYTLKLSKSFALGIGARYICLQDKSPNFVAFGVETSTNLYGVDVAGYYKGDKVSFGNIVGRWRAGFNFSNLRGQSSKDNRAIEIYAPSTLKAGAGFDFILGYNKVLGVTGEYKTLLNSYTENRSGEKLDFILEGSVAALGLEYMYAKKIALRTGYSYGINRLTDTFFSVGAGLRTKYVDVDVAGLLGLSKEESLLRQRLRLSLMIDIAEVFSGVGILEEEEIQN